MPVFNRHGVGVFSFLVDNVSFVEPSLMVSVRKKDVRLATYQEEEDRKKTQTKWVTLINLFFLFFASYLIYSYSTSVVMAVSLMLVNIFGAYLLALGIYKSFVWTKNTLN
ncbi:hypothetical protein [Pedobacter nanyangensis]|uniref:hypothetical protein n=1 Tax=Pedobacter nanyangensis TaxID=1562389 RepID=UPI0013B45CB3|nr:hypothetical protein [Pedobacter nanyangensis]